MSWNALLYLVGMGLVFLGEQLLAPLGAARWIADGLGVIALVGAAVWRYRHLSRADGEGLETGHRIALTTTCIGVGSLLLYVLSTAGTAELLGVGGTNSAWVVVWSALWPIVWLAGTLPLLVVDRAIRQSPVVAPARRFRQALQHGLTAALGLALLFPLNYLAARHSAQWDLSYFQTARPGSATQSVVESLETRVHVYAFLPPNSALREEIEGYFDPIESSKLVVHYVDQTARPRLARHLDVRDNGHLVFSPASPEMLRASAGKDAEDAVSTLTERFEIGTKLEGAEEKLETLDQNVQKQLLSIASGERVAYLTTGHGELRWRGGGSRRRSAKGVKRVMEEMGFRVETLELSELTEGVPREADLVAMIGPDSALMETEVRAFEAFLDRGGSLLLAVEPPVMRRSRVGGDDRALLGGLTKRLGVELGDGVLASTADIVPMAQNKTDRINLVNKQFSSHPSTATLSKHAPTLFLMTPGSGYLETVEGADAEVTMTAHAPSSAWADGNGNLAFDEDAGESRGSRPIAAVSTGATSGSNDKDDAAEWRALVLADATALSDLGLANRGNQQFVYDGINWLIGASALSGTVESGEDVRIRHTKEGQAVWFYATVVGIPILIFAGGALYVWRRRKKGGAS